LRNVKGEHERGWKKRKLSDSCTVEKKRKGISGRDGGERLLGAGVGPRKNDLGFCANWGRKGGERGNSSMTKGVGLRGRERLPQRIAVREEGEGSYVFRSVKKKTMGRVGGEI